MVATVRPDSRDAYGMAVSGQLVKLDFHEAVDIATALNGPGSRSPAKWQDWCAGIDSFGGLVLLAAAM